MMQRSPDIRRTYLEAMGIQLWFPRRANPVSPSEEAEPVTEDRASAAGEASVANRPVDTMPGESAAIESVVPAPNAAHAADLPGRGVDEPVFIQHWWVSGSWLLIETRDRYASAELHQTADKLAGNLLRLISGPSELLIHEVVDWPLFENPSIKRDLEEVHMYLGQKWGMVQRRADISRILLLGSETPALCAFLEPGDAFRCYNGPALEELLENGARKRQLWETLRNDGAVLP